MIQFDEHTYNPSNPVSRQFTGLYTPLYSACLHLGSLLRSVALEAVKYSWFETAQMLGTENIQPLPKEAVWGYSRGVCVGWFFEGFYHGVHHQDLVTWEINPKDWQVLSLGDAGFLQFFRVVSSDYGKPRTMGNHHFSPPVGEYVFFQPLKPTASLPLKIGHAEKEISSSNHLFSGANC